MKIVFVTSEIAPWVKTGGLGDVAAALPPALRNAGQDVRVLVPYYPALQAAFPKAKLGAELPSLGGALPAARLLNAIAADGTPLLLLDCPALYHRSGNPYLAADGRDWHDNAIRFGLLSRVAALLGSAANPLKWQPDIIHCNDWQSALAPAYLRYLPGGRAKSVLTIHNLAFQGIFGPHTLPELGLPPYAWAVDGVEYYGNLSFLKAGLQHADHITTVSPSYAAEIQTDHEGMGMAGLLRYRTHALSGILNGIDTEQWNPATDPLIAAHYDADHLANKKLNKTALQQRMGLPISDTPVFGIVSRLSAQKGLDLVLACADALLALPAQLVLLGSGDVALENQYRALAVKYPDQVAIHIGFDEHLAHQIEAGTDLFLMPSRFEPCGLNQMYSLRYGTPPIVRATGGLADTVIDANNKITGNGFVFEQATPAALLDVIQRAAALYERPRLWRQLQKAAMAAEHGWASPANTYIKLYQDLVKH